MALAVKPSFRVAQSIKAVIFSVEITGKVFFFLEKNFHFLDSSHLQIMLGKPVFCISQVTSYPPLGTFSKIFFLIGYQLVTAYRDISSYSWLQVDKVLLK